MKIGIITFHRSENYGSALQAAALSTVLKQLGHDPVFIDYVCDKDYKQYKLFRTYLYKQNFRSLIADILFLKVNYKRKKNFDNFIYKNFTLTDKLDDNSSVERWSEIRKNFDCFICGSDQIWNPRCFGGFNGRYFLDFVNSKYKIAYAPSFGSMDNFNLIEREELKKYLNSFYFLSVRENSFANILKKEYSMTNVKAVLDPTMLLMPEQINRMCKAVNLNNYIFVYILGNTADYKKELKEINKFADSKGLTIIYSAKKITPELRNGKRLYGFGPNEFLGYIKSADYVFSNSFHATVFSILMNKKFQSIQRKGTNSRIMDLLKMCNLESRCYSINNIDADIDYSKVEKIISSKRNMSLEFLQCSLNSIESLIYHKENLR